MNKLRKVAFENDQHIKIEREKAIKDSKTVKNIDIEIRQRRDYINVNIVDTGTGFKNKKTKDIIKPYFTTKEKGTGLGLSVVEEQQEKKKEKAPKISIQERMLLQITDLCGDWDDLLDKFIEEEKFNLKAFDPEKDLKVYGGGIVKPAHAKMIKDQYETITEEAKENLAGTCDQLREAYSFMDKKMKKDYLAFFEKINAACDAVILTGKANRKQRKGKK